MLFLVSTFRYISHDSFSFEGIGHIPKMNMLAPHSADPSNSQNLFPFMRTKTNMNAIAENNLTKPKTPVKKSEAETVVKPADMKITGASVHLC